MSMQDPRRAPASPALTPLPQVQDLPVVEQGYDRARVDEAFEAFRRHASSLHAQLRVLQAAPKSAIAEPTGHAVRMDALHLVRAAAEFADTIERDAQEAAAKQVARAEQEIRERELKLQQREAEIARAREETERQRMEIVNAARAEAREILANTNRESAQELRQAESSGARLLEQARHQATELTNATRAEVEQTLEWARAQADVIVQRARMGAEQLLAAAGHGDPAVQEAVDAIVRAADAHAQGARPEEQPAEPAERPAEAPAPAPASLPAARRAEPPRPGAEDAGAGGGEQAEEAEEDSRPRGGDERPQPS